MLVLARKKDERILIGPEIEVVICGLPPGCDRGKVKIGIIAPQSIRIVRKEVAERELRASDYAGDEEQELDDQLDEELDELEAALGECGQLPPHLGGGCQDAGTEHCDFDCPFRDHPGLITGEEEDLPQRNQGTEAKSPVAVTDVGEPRS